MSHIPSTIQAVIFDMDGLLIDSEPYWEKADAELFRRHRKKHTPAINKHIMGMKPREIVKYFKEEYGFEGTVDDLLKERLDLLYTFLLGNLSLMDGVMELVEGLAKKKIPMAIATSGHTKARAIEIAEAVGLKNYMTAFVSGDDVKQGKPKPDIFLNAAELLKVEPSSCLVFEDAPNGVMAGKAAGMTVYGVNKDLMIAAKLKNAGADQSFSSLVEVTVL